MYTLANVEIGQATPNINIQKAIHSNRVYRQKLGWRKHYRNIVQVLGLPGKTGESEFAQSVARWQQRKGMKVDGVIGPSTWKVMQMALVKLSGGTRARSSLSTHQPFSILGGFAFGRATLTRKHKTQARDIARFVLSRQGTREPVRWIQIVGHTDRVGKEIRNCTLGMKRARIVAAAILNAIYKQGGGRIPPQLAFIFESSGKAQPVPGNQALSRRVEVFLSTTLKPLPPRGKCPLPGHCVCRETRSSGNILRPLGGIDSSGILGSPSCTIACRALESMARSADGICRLQGTFSWACLRAKARLTAARAQVFLRCGRCL